MADYTAIVLAKAPVPGRVKTRLCPPCAPEEAAAIATGALVDTLAAVSQVSAARHLLVLDGEPGEWLPDGWEVIPQCEGGLDRRLGAAFAAADGPAVLVGMDTPQLRADAVEAAGHAVVERADRAVLGLANDGGFWIVALPRGGPQHFDGVPMSKNDTGERQRRRLVDRGLSVTNVEVLMDVDSWDEAQAVAAEAPDGRFAAEVAAVAGRLP
ncbi:MAG: DUF2064 domain-containing protein [Microthrixaceae bacterium]